MKPSRRQAAVRAAGLLLLLLARASIAQTAVPTISGYQLTTGAASTGATPGTQLVIKGANLGSSGTLKFNNVTLSYNAWAPTYIRVVVPSVPSLPTTAPFTATTAGQTAVGPPFTVIGSGPPPPPAPAITGYQSTSGSAMSSAVPGTSVVIVGSNLGTSGTVTFNGIAATTSSWSATAITVTVPAAASYPSSGAVAITTGGQTATGPSFTITAPPPPRPSITGYQTTGGSSISSAAPGTQVVIVGTNFGSSGTVQFNGITASAGAWSATAITATVPTPPGFPNTGAVSVTTGGQTGSGSSFTITAPPPPPPSITDYQTTSGTSITSAIPGTQVVIVGTNFGSTGTVTFNGISAPTLSWTATAITATVPTPPSYPSAGPVSVTTSGQSATGSSFTITAPPPPPAPSVSGYQATTGAPITSALPGTPVVITGANFGTSGTVQFNGSPATPSAWSDSAITATVPVAAAYPNVGPVSVTSGGQTGTGPAFTIMAPPPPPPTISGYQTTGGTAISSGVPGSPVVIVGTNLGSPGTVTFNGISAAASSWTATAITVTVPTAASYPSTGPVVVTTGGQTATGADFTITAPPPPPAISDYQTTSGLSITSAPAGTPLVIVGANFGSAGVVQFNGTSATTTAWSDTAITATVPTVAGYPATGPITVTVAVSGQTATGADFTITAPPPLITGYQTTGGVPIASASPGTQVVIVGTNLGSLGVVSFNGNTATPATWTATAITVTVPTPGSLPDAGPVVVTVGGQDATGPTFTIVAPVPTVTGYQAATGATITGATAGSTVVIVGTNLGTSGTVQFNGIPAVATVWTTNAITVTVPTATSYPSTGPVTVTTGGSTAAGADFSVYPPTGATVHNVVDYGATGDGATDDQAAIQRAMDAAAPGDSVYFPSGSYRISASVRVRVSNVRVYGNGDSSSILGPTDLIDIFQVTGTSPVSGVQFDHLRIVGAGIFDKNLNGESGIGLLTAIATQISSCTFDGCGIGVSDSLDTTGTTISNCHITNWGRVGVFCNAGATVQNTLFDQHDPNAQDEVTSHGVYIHSGADNCVVQGCTFSGVRYYGIQVYGQTVGTTMNNIQIIGNQFMDNAQDITIQSAGPTIAGVTITGNSFYRTHGYSVTVKAGIGIHVDGNQFYDTSHGAVIFGNWAPYDAGATLSDVSADGNTYTQSSGSAPQFMFDADGANGTLSSVSFQGNTAQGVHESGIYHGAAIYLSQVLGANIGNNVLTMGAGAGTDAVCSGVEVSTGCSGIQVFNNTVNGTSAPLAYGLYATGLTATSSVVSNLFYHCKLQTGGATASGNTVTP